MKLKNYNDIMSWVLQEVQTFSHGEIHIVLKVRDSHVALIEKTKIVKEKPLE